VNQHQKDQCAPYWDTLGRRKSWIRQRNARERTIHRQCMKWSLSPGNHGWVTKTSASPAHSSVGQRRARKATRIVR
jgi:hypothetical protein